MNSFLQQLPLNNIARYSGVPPRDAIPFIGYPRQSPSEKSKIILVCDPLEKHPTILEFKMDDVMFVEETHQAVTEAGEGILLVKLWVRKGAYGMILEPFEVKEHVKFSGKSRALKERFIDNFSRPDAHP